MKIFALILSVVATLVAGCVAPGYATFTSSDAKGRTVIELDMSYLADSMKGECFTVSALNGVALDSFKDRRVERDSQGKLTKVFVLIPPGRYTVSFGYVRNAMYLGGRDFWVGDVTKEVELSVGRYRANGVVDGSFVSLWIENDSGTQITVPEKSLIKKNDRPTYLVVPIPI